MLERPLSIPYRVSSVPRPLIAVLVVAVLFFALWTVALKHTLTGGGGASAGANSPNAPALQSAINKARGLQSVVNGAGARAGGTPTQSAQPSTSTAAGQPAPSGQSPASQQAKAAASSSGAGATTSPQPATRPSPAPASRPTGMALVDQALRQHKVLALLFYNPAAADDRAVHGELASIPTHGGKVVKLTVPVQKLGHFSSLLNEVPVNFSPTLVLIGRDRQAEELAGFADSFEIAQRVAAALGSASPKH
jgi:hypothetical protein